jgi:HK97 family phage prohead protease
MNKIFKLFKGVVKSINEKDFTVDVVVSTASVDRDKEKINTEAFKKRLKFYKDHPVLLSSHRYDDLRKQIGEAANIKVTDEGLEAKFKYYVGEGNPEADWAWVLAQKGIAGFSIGFMPFEYEDKDLEKDGYRREYTDIELVEISQVLVPSNREAVQARRNYVTNLNDVEKDLLEVAIKSFEAGELQDREDICPACKAIITKPEETEDYIRIPVRDCKITATITISAEQGIKALYCGEVKKIATYLFAKDKGWTMEKAKAWVKEHEEKKDINPEELYAAQVTQEFQQKVLDVIGSNIDVIYAKIIEKLKSDEAFVSTILASAAKRPDAPLNKEAVLSIVTSALQQKEKK